MSTFEVKDILMSDIVLDSKDFIPRRRLSIQVDYNYEAIKDLKALASVTNEQLAKELGDAIAKAFNAIVFTPSNMGEKLGVTISPIDSGFGWYKMKERENDV